jgi:hypothetical protein
MRWGIGVSLLLALLVAVGPNGSAAGELGQVPPLGTPTPTYGPWPDSPVPSASVPPRRVPTFLPSPSPVLAATPTATSTVPPGASPSPVPTEIPRLGQWVTNPQPIELWASPEPDALSLGRAPAGSRFDLTGSSSRGRLFVYYPGFQEYAWIDATGVVPVSDAPAGPAPRGAGPEVVQTINLPGRALGYTVRSWPRVAPATRLRELPHNTPVFVYEAVRGDDGELWYRVGEGEYIHSAGVRLPQPPPQVFAGRWIDVDLAEPTLMTAYEDDRVVYTALALRGTVVDSTPTGTHRILRRVENETMDSATIGIPRDSPRGYYLRDVLYTQYFTTDGAAIHYNYWSSHFGYAGTHGCLGVNLDDARWFWDWADLGTIVNIH